MSDAQTPDASDGALPFEAAALGLEVQTKLGALTGGLDGDTRAFLGVPYAAPPVGELRLSPPQPAPAWQGVRNATSAGPSCIQPKSGGSEGPQAEDCLTLNVFAPVRSSQQLRPVMVFLHGGAFVTGAGKDIPPRHLREAGDLVVVTVNYRLGSLGFLAHPALDAASRVPSGNLALRDQQAALRWVRENIEAFGGDSKNVTLFGQSAGGISSCLHLFAKGSAELFDRVIIESGSCLAGLGAPRKRADMVRVSGELINQLCPGAVDVPRCLRALPASSFPKSSLAEDVLFAGWWPIIDGELLTESPMQSLKQGRIHNKPIVLGSNRNEYALEYTESYPLGPIGDRVTFTAVVTARYPDESVAIMQHYAVSSDAEANDVYVRLTTDRDHRCPTRALARGAARAGLPVFLYSFDVHPAIHTMELDYVFNWPGSPVSKTIREAPIPQIASLASTMQSYWTTFAAKGDPNSPGQPTWPRYQESEDANVVLGERVTTARGLASADCDFWDGMFATRY